MAPDDPTPGLPEPDAVTPADVLTPHGRVKPKPAEGDEPDAEPGIIDPRRLGPPIVDPPQPGLPRPGPAAPQKPSTDQ